MAKRPKRLKVGNLLITVVILAVAGYLFFNAGKDIWMTFKLTSQVNDSQKEIEKLEAENQKLVNQKNKLQDPEYVKSYARGAYMLSKNGEQIFHISGGDD